jgi:hypothetical protein
MNWSGDDPVTDAQGERGNPYKRLLAKLDAERAAQNKNEAR